MASVNHAGITEKSDISAHIQETEFWNVLMHDVFGPRKGGAIIFLDAENARKGVAKTSCAVALGRLFANAFGYELVEEDLTLSAGDYLQRYQEHPGHEQPSVLVLDEFVGAGAGDKRRAMAQQNVDFGRAWQLLRTKRVVTIATLPDWNEADKRLKKLADYRVWCREQPMGTFQAYKITVPFASGGSTTVRTKGMGPGEGARRIQFPNMDAHADRLYYHLSEEKDDLIHSDGWDADDLREQQAADAEETVDAEEIQRREAIKFAVRLRAPWSDDRSPTYREIAEVIDGYSKKWVGDTVRGWKDGKYRDIVDKPDHL